MIILSVSPSSHMLVNVWPIASSLQADSEVKFAAWPPSWRPPSADWLTAQRETCFILCSSQSRD